MIIILKGQPIHTGGNNQIINGIRFYMHFREKLGLHFQEKIGMHFLEKNGMHFREKELTKNFNIS